MNIFQWVCLPILGYVLLRELLSTDRDRHGRYLTFLVWGGAAAAIAFPSLTQFIANVVGIARGADLVQYFFILVFLAVGFHLHAQSYALQQQVASLVRAQAKHEACFSDEAALDRKSGVSDRKPNTPREPLPFDKGDCEVAVIIVAYNAAVDLREALASLQACRSPGVRQQVIVVDNASTDDTARVAAEEFPDVVLLRSEKNLGFAAGNNLGWEYVRDRLPNASLVCLLNQDVVVTPEWLAPVVGRFSDDPSVGSVQSKLLLHDQPHRINTAGNVRHFLGFGFIGAPEAEDGEAFSKVAEIGYPSGAAVTLRADFLRAWGLFDGDYFMYLEDAELGWNVVLAGLRNEVQPASRVLHKYSFRRDYSHYFWLERNRWLLLLTHYRIGTLVAAAPMLWLMELGQLYFSIRIGRLGDKLRSWAWFARPDRMLAVWRRRRWVQRRRRATDHVLLRGATAHLPAVSGGPAPSQVAEPTVGGVPRNALHDRPALRLVESPPSRAAAPSESDLAASRLRRTVFRRVSPSARRRSTDE